MKNIKFIFLLIFFSSQSIAQNATDKLIVTLVDKKLPSSLYEHNDRPWELGVYSLKVNKIGSVGVHSDDRKLRLTLPIEVVLNSKVNRNILGATIALDCNSSFSTVGRLYIEPLIKPTDSRAEVNIAVPVPESFLNCDGFKLPMKSLLEKLISENKSKWENDLEDEIYKLFQQMGI